MTREIRESQTTAKISAQVFDICQRIIILIIAKFCIHVRLYTLAKHEGKVLPILNFSLNYVIPNLKLVVQMHQ